MRARLQHKPKAKASQKLCLADFLKPDQAFHIATGRYAARTTFQLHTHDFAELFVIEEGAGTHVINQTTVIVKTGDLVFIRPWDVHGFKAQGRQSFTMINLAFSAETVDDLQQRYFEEQSDEKPWHDEALPRMVSLSGEQLLWVTRMLKEMDGRQQERLLLDACLLRLLAGLKTSTTRHAPSGAPTWLAVAIEHFQRQEYIAEGMDAFVRLAGRSPEHINRQVQSHFGMTTTKMVNQMRLDHAASMLRMTNRSIVDIAAQSGFDNLSYFYRCFSRRFGNSPRRFRLQQQLVAS